MNSTWKTNLGKMFLGLYARSQIYEMFLAPVGPLWSGTRRYKTLKNGSILEKLENLKSKFRSKEKHVFAFSSFPEKRMFLMVLSHHIFGEQSSKIIKFGWRCPWHLKDRTSRKCYVYIRKALHGCLNVRCG